MTLRSFGILALLFFTLIAWVLSMTVNMEGVGLGGLYNIILPPFVGLISLIIYLLVCWLTNDKAARIFALIACCLYLVYIGLTFRLNPGNLPIPF